MGIEAEEILEKSEGSCLETTRIKSFCLEVEGASVDDPRLALFKQFAGQLMLELNSPDSTFEIYPTKESIEPFLDSLESQVLPRYGLVWAWMASVQPADEDNEETFMTITLVPYEFADIFGYKLQ